MSLRLAPDDARRGGLVIVGATAEQGAELARLYADGGYETIVPGVDERPETLALDLQPPVFLLALPDGAAVAWDATGVAAVSIVGDMRVQDLLARAPASPAILHLSADAHAAIAEAFEADRPEIPVHLHSATPDGERLFQLRTLRLFSTNAGGRGEV